jgi:galactose mutarotase-like enzyme
MAMTLRQMSTPYAHWEYVHPQSGDRLRVVPERGGIVTEWLCNGREILYFDQTRYADPKQSIRGGIPVLFPICGNLPGDRLPLKSGEATLKQHGFARGLPWQLELLDDQSGVRLSLTETEETFADYPFRFRLEMAVRPVSGALEITTTIANANEGGESMPFSFGLHPYFNVTDLSRTTLEGLAPQCLNHLVMAEAENRRSIEPIARGGGLSHPPCWTGHPGR